MPQTIEEFGGVRVNTATGAVDYRGERYTLGRVQTLLLACVLRCRGRPVPRSMIEDVVWDDARLDFNIQQNISVNITHIKRKTGIRLVQIRSVGTVMIPADDLRAGGRDRCASSPVPSSEDANAANAE